MANNQNQEREQDRSQFGNNQGGQKGNNGGGGKQETSGGRGFAGMDEDRQREIAAEGGRASHEKGTGHEFSPEEAREAGRKGGQSRGK